MLSQLALELPPDAVPKFITNSAERWPITILNFYEKEGKYKICQNDTREKQAYFP